MAEVLIFTALSAAMYAAANAINKPPSDPSGPFDNTIQTISQRGSFIPYLIGRRKLGPFFMYTGAKRIVKESNPGGGIGKGGPKPGKTKIFYQQGAHALCVGPAQVLNSITKNGKVIFEGPITRWSHPSGTAIQAIEAEGVFRIYWGEHNQAIDQVISDDVVDSRFPFICYVMWDDMRLGQQQTWPSLEYDVSCNPMYSQLGGEIDTGPTSSAGSNLAHALDQMLFAAAPHGLNLDRSKFDIPSLLAMARDPSVPLCNLLIKDGGKMKESVLACLKDAGYMIPWVVAKGKFIFKEIREPVGILPQLTPDTISNKVPEIKTDLRGLRSTNLVFYSYSDSSRDFEESSVTIRADGTVLENANQFRPKKIKMALPITLAEAAKVAERRSQEANSTAASYVIHANREARNMFPGKAFTVSAEFGILQVLRVVNKTINPLSSEVRLECIEDYYGLPASTFQDPDPGVPPAPPTPPPAPNPRSNIWEVPYLAGGPGGGGGGGGGTADGGSGGVIDPWLRDDPNSFAIEVYISADNVTYTQIGTDIGFYAGGTLTEEIPLGGPAIIEEGPTANNGVDLGLVLDLESSPIDFWAGRQVALINDELFLVRRIEITAPNTFKLRGLVRARGFSERQVHPAGSSVFIFDPFDMVLYSDVLMAPGASLYFKTQPVGIGGAAVLDDVTPVQIAYEGRALLPKAPRSVRTSTGLVGAGGVLIAREGDGAEIKWDYTTPASVTNRTGAGFQRAGEPVGSTQVFGHFVVEIYAVANFTTPVRIFDTTAVQVKYEWADILADFAGNPGIFRIEVFACVTGYDSPKKVHFIRIDAGA